MVKEKKMNNEKIYLCEACDMVYSTKELAQKCETFCIKNKSCSLEIIKHALKK